MEDRDIFREIGGQLYHWAACALNGRDDFLCDGQVHGCTNRVVTDGVALHVRYLRMCEKHRLVWGRVGDEVALRGDVVRYPLLLRLPVEAFDQAQVDFDGGGGRNDVIRFGSGARRREAVDVQRRLVQQCQQRLAPAVGVTQPELLA